jgi:hypothetical protein
VSIVPFKGAPVTLGIGCRKQGGQPQDGSAKRLFATLAIRQGPNKSLHLTGAALRCFVSQRLSSGPAAELHRSAAHSQTLTNIAANKTLDKC